MTATDELRRLLDELGVEHEGEDFKRYAYTYWGDWVFMEPLDAKPHTLGAQCELMLAPATPEQAIAATLGAGTLQAENAKLRELVRDMWTWQDAVPYGMHAEICDRMRELGVEV